jgi:hypothetical protein
MSDHNSLVGKKFGSWTIVLECTERYKGSKMVVCRCDCGFIRRSHRAPFLTGYNSEKCFDCHLKQQKLVPMTSLKRE